MASQKHGSQTILGANQASTAGGSQHMGGTVAETRPQQCIIEQAENPGHVVDTELVSFKPIVFKPGDPGYDLNFWPTVLKIQPTIALTTLYIGTALAIAMSYWGCIKAGGQFHVSSENVHMIARYFPSVLGTVNVILFRQTVREFIRMTPYVNMADQVNGQSIGAIPWKSVSGAFFPWQDITISHGFVQIISLICQIGATFIVSLKVALFATIRNPNGSWSLTVRPYPAVILIAGHCIMAMYTLLVAFLFRGKSTGLKWDPISIADYVALFAKCNALKYFEPLELRHDRSAKDLVSPNQRFRLGYWEKTERDPNHPEEMITEKVYGIGIKFNAQEDDIMELTIAPEKHWYRPWKPGERPPDPTPMSEHNESCKKKKILHTPCEHYPFRQSPGCARWLLICATLVIWAALGASIFALSRPWPYDGFWLPNDWSLPSNVTLLIDDHRYTAPPVDPNDPKSTLLAYALIFRSAPTYIAGLFTSSIIQYLDLNMRFMQPFVNMLQRPADADATVLLAYLTMSPIQVPLTAYTMENYKVCWYSVLNSISPLLPIFVGGLLTVSSGGTEYPHRVNFNFSLSAYVGIMVFLVIYAVSIPWAYPHPHRLLPRQFYSMADLMAFCHQARFLGSPHLDIHDKDCTPKKEYMEARIRLSRDKFLFGKYKGRDNEWHMGFDVEETRGKDNLHEIKGIVEPIKPQGYEWLMREQVRVGTIKAITRAGTFLGGDVNSIKNHIRNDIFAKRSRDVNERGEYELTKGTSSRHSAISSGSNAPGSGGSTNGPTARFNAVTSHSP